MKRKIIKIDEEKCNGCGLCTNVCAEAALEIVDGKAKLIKDFLCDGMGACLDVCPVDALHIIEEESKEYDPKKAYEHVKKERGENEAKRVHGYEQILENKTQEEPMRCGCPGTMMRDMRGKIDVSANHKVNANSALRQWPAQLRLLNPQAPYFQNADLLISADCVPFAYANFHDRFLKDKTLAIFCPKLDQEQDEYLEKLTEIFKHCNIKSVTVARMEVPCCGGTLGLVEQAMQKSGVNIIIKDYVVNISGDTI